MFDLHPIRRAWMKGDREGDTYPISLESVRVMMMRTNNLET